MEISAARVCVCARDPIFAALHYGSIRFINYRSFRAAAARQTRVLLVAAPMNGHRRRRRAVIPQWRTEGNNNVKSARRRKWQSMNASARCVRS
jgi:hypothetical protein